MVNLGLMGGFGGKWEYGWTRLEMGGGRLVDAQIDFFLAEFYKVGEVRHCRGGLSDVGISTIQRWVNSN